MIHLLQHTAAYTSYMFYDLEIPYFASGDKYTLSEIVVNPKSAHPKIRNQSCFWVYTESGGDRISSMTISASADFCLSVFISSSL